MSVSGVRAALAYAARVALLAGPTVLAFFAGGYFDAPRIWAGLIAWLLVAIGAIVSPRPVPRGAAATTALLGLSLLAAWTVASFTWAPVPGSAYHAGQLVVLYVGVLVASAALLRPRSVQRAVEPALAAGATIVVGYGLAGRMLPGLLHYARSVSAQGRLEQPLTYWNAMGELAAIGLVLALRIAGDSTRPRVLRIAAAATIPALGMGLYLSFSRGALFACLAGLVTLVVVVPQVAQFKALVLGAASAVLAALVAAPFGAVTSLAGTLATRERDGAIVLMLLLATSALTGVAAWRIQVIESDRELSLPRRAPQIALAVICAGLAVAIVAGAKEHSAQPLAPGASRLESLQSNRYDYWRVAFNAFEQEPLRGLGAGGWAVAWLEHRPIDEGAQDAHSLPLQTAAELGLVGLALLLVFVGGVVAAARSAVRRTPALAAGPVAGFVVYLAHAPLDWDWQMPAVTLVALVLAGLLLALSDKPPQPVLQDEAAATETAPPIGPGAGIRSG